MVQPLRRAPDGRHWLCQADGCDQIGTLSWTIKADDQGNVTNRYGCDLHRFSDDDPVAGLVHQMGCAAPAPPCTCTPEVPK